MTDDLMVDLIATWIDPDLLWKAWMEALMKGPYQQGTAALLRDGKYCSLGVLCTTAGIPATVSVLANHASSFAGRRACLPDELAEFLNITHFGDFRHAVPALKRRIPREEYPAGSVVSLNDNAGWSFQEQARYLDKHRNNMRAYGYKS